MQPVRTDLTVFEHRDFLKKIPVIDEAGVPVGFSGFTFTGRIARDFYDRINPGEFSVTSDKDGEITISISADQIDALGFNMGIYEVCKAIGSPESVEVVAHGRILILPSIPTENISGA